MPRAFTLLLLSIGIWLMAVPAQGAGDTAYTEDAVKAAYLHRFAAYVEWPAPAPTDAAFTIGVLGSDAVLEQLERLLPSININGRGATARAVKGAADLDGISILYVAPGRLATAKSLIAAAASHAVLVVTDDPDGMKSGGAINFVRVGANVRFEVSLPAADRSGLKIDAALLAIATHVEAR